MRKPFIILAAALALMVLYVFPATAKADSIGISLDGEYNLSDYAEGDIIIIDAGKTVTLTGSAGVTYTNIQIISGEGVDLTLKDVTIDDSAVSGVCPVTFSGGGNTLTLNGDTTLTGGSGQPGLGADSGVVLTINGGGSLTATGGAGAAGIGGAAGSGGGNIAITKSTVSAAAGSGAQDIGAGESGTGGSISISGNAAVLLKNDSSAPVTADTHVHYTVSGTAGDKIYGVKLAWTGDAGAYLRLYTISFDANGGSGTAAAVTQHVGTSAALPDTGVERVGYTLAGWNTAADGSGEAYESGGSMTLDADATLYAQWTANTYTVTYDINGGDGGETPDSTHTYGVAAKLSRNGFKMEGYDFTGWALSADGNLVYQDEQSVTNLTAENGGTVPLYATWKQKTFTVTFYRSNGTTQVGKTQTVTYGDKAKTYSAPEHTLQVFVGWKLMGDNPKETPSLKNVTQNIRAVAQYIRLPFTVTFVDGNGKTIGTDYAYYGGSADAPEAPLKEGYTFTGWDASFGFIKKSMTVTAQYELNTYTVRFRDNDGSLIGTQQVEWSGAAKAPEDLVKTGYTFVGWDKDFGTVTTDLTVTAQYEKSAEQETPTMQQGSRPDKTQTQTFPWWWIIIGIAVAGGAVGLTLAARKRNNRSRPEVL